jgi:DNA-binding SARP family transcriptional activator
LRQALSSLRGQLEPPGVPAGSVLFADRHTVRLNPDAVTTDVAAFEAALAAARQAAGNGNEATLLAQALALYGGTLLPGYYDEWILGAQERLSQQFFTAGHRLLGLLAQSGDVEAAIGCAHRMIAVDPVREESYRDLIRLLAGEGRVSEALRQYRTIERLLDQQMGGEAPSAALRQLARELEQRRGNAGEEAASIPAQAASPQTVPPAPALLPAANLGYGFYSVAVPVDR